MRTKRYEQWQEEYRRDRYLEHASDRELQDRFRDVFYNMIVLTNAGQIGLNELDEGGAYWGVIWTHVLEEYNLRQQHLPYNVVDPKELPAPTFPKRPVQADAFHHLREELRGLPFLIKFGNASWLKKTFEEEAWRITSGSSYSDPSLNSARQDSGLEITRHARASEYHLKVFDRSGRLKGALRPPDGYLTWNYSMSTDYYVSCLSATFSVRLFDDFDADSCVVIRNPIEFRTRLFDAAQRTIPNFYYGLEPVKYIDPYNCQTDDVRVPTSKHFRYWYQHEWRFVWVPEHAQKQLDTHVVLDIGPMKDIALFVNRH